MTKIIVQERPQTNIVGLLYRGKANADELPRLWEQLNQRQAEISPNDGTNNLAYGISVMGQNFEQTQEFDYVAGFPSDMDADSLPEGMVRFTIPGGLYAVGICPNLAIIEETFNTIYNRWLPESDYDLDNERGEICFEVYDQRFDPATGTGEFEVYVPVKEKNNAIQA